MRRVIFPRPERGNNGAILIGRRIFEASLRSLAKTDHYKFAKSVSQCLKNRGESPYGPVENVHQSSVFTVIPAKAGMTSENQICRGHRRSERRLS